jgi:hypothetical protein
MILNRYQRCESLVDERRMQRWWLAAGGRCCRAHELPRCDAEVVEGHAYALCGGSVRLVRMLFFSQKMVNEG